MTVGAQRCISSLWLVLAYYFLSYNFSSIDDIQALVCRLTAQPATTEVVILGVGYWALGISDDLLNARYSNRLHQAVHVVVTTIGKR